MTTFIILTLAALVILAVLGAAFMFTWFCAMAAGRTVGWALGVNTPPAADDTRKLLAPEHIAEIDALVASSQRMAREASLSRP